jgi:hypothetical protein
MAFWSMAMMGSTAIGGPIIGWMGEYVGPRYALGFGGFATVLVALYAYLSIRRSYPGSSLAFAPVDETEGDEVTISKRS